MVEMVRYMMWNLKEKDDLGFPVVAKFFEYSGDDKEKRYNSVNCNRK